MITDQCVSVTDLKKDMNAIIKDLRKEKIIFVNNVISLYVLWESVAF